MIVGHVIARREARRQRKAQWMIGRCYPQEVKTTDIMIEEPVIEVIKIEPVVMVYSQEKIDEAETMRKLILLQTTLNSSLRKSNLTLCYNNV